MVLSDGWRSDGAELAAAAGRMVLSRRRRRKEGWLAVDRRSMVLPGRTECRVSEPDV